MKLEKIDLKKLKTLKPERRGQKIEEFERKKALLIQEYIKIQDILDEYNEKLYEMSCEIEQLNIVIRELNAKNRKA